MSGDRIKLGTSYTAITANIISANMERGLFGGNTRQDVLGETSRQVNWSVSGVVRVDANLASHYRNMGFGLGLEARDSVSIRSILSTGQPLGANANGPICRI